MQTNLSDERRRHGMMVTGKSTMVLHNKAVSAYNLNVLVTETLEVNFNYPNHQSMNIHLHPSHMHNQTQVVVDLIDNRVRLVNCDVMQLNSIVISQPQQESSCTFKTWLLFATYQHHFYSSFT